MPSKNAYRFKTPTRQSIVPIPSTSSSLYTVGIVYCIFKLLKIKNLL